MNDLEFMLHYARKETERRVRIERNGGSPHSVKLRMNYATTERVHDLFASTCMRDLWGSSYYKDAPGMHDDEIMVVADD